MIRKEIKERLFTETLRLSAVGVILLVVAMFGVMLVQSSLAIETFGFGFLTSQSWNPVEKFLDFGALPFIVGTLLTAFISLLISIPFSISVAIFLGEYYRKGKASAFFSSIIELMAGIPSVIYGFWGLFYVVPIITNIQKAFGLEASGGPSVLAASIVLSIMIIPYTASIAREVIAMVPIGLKEGAYALGATRFEVIKDVVLPYCKSGIFAGVFLSLGRALGETMAVTMVIGNKNLVPASIFEPGNSMASIIANEFAEANGGLLYSVLIEMGLILLVITTVINVSGKMIIKKLGKS